MSALENTETAARGASPQSPERSVLSEKSAEDTGEQSGFLSKGKKLLGLGKKKEEGDKKTAGDASSSSLASKPAAALAPSPPLSPPSERRLSPRNSPRMYPVGVGSSPNRRVNRSSSPAFHSPASSQIFERNVQESVGELSPEIPIPSHIQVLEDHIPPVLEASALAISDDHLNPDEVEIVMHSAHQTAADTVAEGISESVYSPSQDDMSGRLPVSPQGQDDSGSNYGSIDTGDVRRLSFISFADVVQSEHVDTNKDPLQFMSLSSTANRSPSPVRSPASSHGFSASPPTSGATSEKGVDLVSPKAARVPGSPTTAGANELQIETMRQALRKTGSGDLGAPTSQPLSAVSLEDSAADQPPFK